MVCYADSLVLLRQAKRQTVQEQMATRKLGLNLSRGKSKFIRQGKKRLETASFSLCIELGITMSKTSPAVGVMNIVWYILPVKVKMLFYNASTYSILQYCGFVCGTTRITNFTKELEVCKCSNTAFCLGRFSCACATLTGLPTGSV